MGPDPASPFSCFFSWTQTLTPLCPLPLGKQTTWFRAALCSVSAKVCSEDLLCPTTGFLLPCQISRTEPLSRTTGTLSGPGVHSGSLDTVPVL